ncbi:hypothetical protein RSAG8_07576, partial [Rhizoctonia solani AG-8 WAC10335]
MLIPGVLRNPPLRMTTWSRLNTPQAFSLPRAPTPSRTAPLASFEISGPLTNAAGFAWNQSLFG